MTRRRPTLTLAGVTSSLHVAFNYDDAGVLESVDVNVESMLLFMECLLNGAMNDYLRYPADNELFDNARLWLFDDEGEDVTSFRTCCAVLGVGADKVRFVANGMKDRGKVRLFPVEFGAFLEACRR